MPLIGRPAALPRITWWARQGLAVVAGAGGGMGGGGGSRRVRRSGFACWAGGAPPLVPGRRRHRVSFAVISTVNDTRSSIWGGKSQEHHARAVAGARRVRPETAAAAGHPAAAVFALSLALSPGHKS